jgi:hypothetical protein
LAYREIPYGRDRNVPDAEISNYPLETACSKLYLSSAKLGISPRSSAFASLHPKPGTKLFELKRRIEPWQMRSLTVIRLRELLPFPIFISYG